MLFLMQSSSYANIIFTFLLLGYSNYLVSPVVAFTSLGILLLLVVPFTWSSEALTLIAITLSSLSRIGQYVKRKPSYESYILYDNCDIDNLEKDGHAVREDILIEIVEGEFQWKEKITLRDINIQVREKEKLIIIGPVGSGKSSLLKAFVGIIPKNKGKVIRSKSSISYVPQFPWILHGTIEDNIVFGNLYDEQKLQTLLKITCLEKDIAAFPKGLNTEIGERGINLSGGQKQRISLARALYTDAQVFLFDDSLSAVDPSVRDEIYRNCFSIYLKEKAVCFVTNQIEFLPLASKIVMLEEGIIC